VFVAHAYIAQYSPLAAMLIISFAMVGEFIAAYFFSFDR
jgi:hypothetical protein